MTKTKQNKTIFRLKTLYPHCKKPFAHLLAPFYSIKSYLRYSLMYPRREIGPGTQENRAPGARSQSATLPFGQWEEQGKNKVDSTASLRPVLSASLSIGSTNTAALPLRLQRQVSFAFFRKIKCTGYLLGT
jgi:hypothetical protein